jgi:small conductance mechanosensitive channel
MESIAQAINIPFIKDAYVWMGLEVLFLLLAGWIGIRILARLVRKALSKTGLDPMAHTLVIRVVKIALWVVLILLIIGKLDKSLLAPIITVLGTCGVAIALALKDSLGNVAGGLILVFTKPFTAGDEVDIGGNSGLVDRIDLFTTHLHTFDNRIIIIPNGVITNSTIVNASRTELRRVDATFYVGYDSDIEQVKRIVHQLAEDGPMLLSEPEPFIALQEHGDSSLVFKVGIWCRTEDRFRAATYIEENVKLRFDEEGISIPYPHMEVRIHEVTAEEDD